MPQSAPTPSKPRRRWPYILLAIFVGIPVLAFLILQIVFSINAIPEEKLEPPAELLRETSAIARTHHVPLAAPTPLPKTYLELIGLHPFDPRAIAYAFLENRDIAYEPIIRPAWVQGEPLSKAQRDWLDQHRIMVETAVSFAAAGGLPPFPREVTGTSNPLLIPLPDYLAHLRCAEILALESRRRYESGDLAGAVDLLLAVGPVATSIQEPWLFSHAIATGVAEIPTRYVKHWIESGDSIPAEIASRLHTGLLPYPLRIEDARFVLEMEYQSPRALAVDLLNGPLLELVRDRFSSDQLGTNIAGNPYQEDYWAEAKIYPANTARATLEALGRAVSSKARAQSILEKYDAWWRKQFLALDKGDSITSTTWGDDFFSLEIFATGIHSHVGRIDAAEARRNLVLAALARIAEIPDAPLPRDPFTRAPLTVLSQPDGATTFYSLGPDLADQRGALAYDPTNGTISPGDITLRLPPR